MDIAALPKLQQGSHVLLTSISYGMADLNSMVTWCQQGVEDMQLCKEPCDYTFVSAHFSEYCMLMDSQHVSALPLSLCLNCRGPFV